MFECFKWNRAVIIRTVMSGVQLNLLTWMWTPLQSGLFRGSLTNHRLCFGTSLRCQEGVACCCCFLHFGHHRGCIKRTPQRQNKKRSLSLGSVHPPSSPCGRLSVSSVMAEENLSLVLHAVGDLRLVGGRPQTCITSCMWRLVTIELIATFFVFCILSISYRKIVPSQSQDLMVWYM